MTDVLFMSRSPGMLAVSSPNARYQPRPKSVGCMPWFDP
jgi:hypothetical protein